MAYEVTHRTEYRYPSTVSSSFGEIIMLPRDLPGQACVRSELMIDPAPHDLRQRIDFFGNRVAYFAVLAPHTRLSVTATSLVRVHGRRVEAAPALELGWEQARDRLRADTVGELLEARQFVLDSPLVTLSEQLAEYAAQSFPPGQPVLAAVTDLASRIYRDFEFLPGATEVKTTIDEVFARRAGVCQDFAHVAIGCLRSLGLAARYVSGYLETRPPPGKARIAGADVSHAWVSAFVPGAGWVDVDPTNDQLVNDRYVTTAWGRDYTDVPPLKGVIFTEGDVQDLRVSVDVIPVDDPD
ncbi:transglutaminase family protein [Pseudonocardia sp. Cha107L01]|uniref:transglutaminase family protein n=1 Tax=Pseudonocardia sp. Cha107L01 TaxID=3457576 RepID=UPI00403EB62D